jgi:phosphoglycolate phosphatase-like HAD superfamily hydrolase
MTLIFANGRKFDVSCIVFDKDGTLLDLDFTWGRRTADWIRVLANLAPGDKTQFEHFSLAIGYDWTKQQILSDGPVAVTTAQKLVTLAAGALYQQSFPWHEAERLALKTIRQTMGLPIHADDVRPVGDVKGTIQRLKDAGLLLAVATGDDRDPTELTLTLLGIADDMALLVCGDDPLPEKPDPAVLFHIESQVGISTKQMLMVGDSVNDMLTGHNAAVAGCIGITGSTGDPLKLATHADVILPSIEHLTVIESTH